MDQNVSQTLSNIVGWCWTVFDQCWVVLDAGVLKQIQHHPTMLDFSTRHEFTDGRSFDHVNKIVGKYWIKSLNKVKLQHRLNDVVHHVWLYCSIGSDMLCPTIFDIMFDQHV